MFGASWPELKVNAGRNGGRLKMITTGTRSLRRRLRKMKTMKFREVTSVSLRKMTLLLNRKNMKYTRQRPTGKAMSFL
jgi:hypothetical protein